MNERIQELADIAEGHADLVMDRGGEFHTSYTEKLSELILEECINILQSRKDHTVIVNSIKEIKEHFGVS